MEGDAESDTNNLFCQSIVAHKMPKSLIIEHCQLWRHNARHLKFERYVITILTPILIRIPMISDPIRMIFIPTPTPIYTSTPNPTFSPISIPVHISFSFLLIFLLVFLFVSYSYFYSHTYFYFISYLYSDSYSSSYFYS